jgi:hypothetical protein
VVERNFPLGEERAGDIEITLAVMETTPGIEAWRDDAHREAKRAWPAVLRQRLEEMQSAWRAPD